VFSVSLDLGKLTVRLAKMVVWPDQTSFNRTGRISVRPRSRGGVKVPTGGNGERSPKPASARRESAGSADSVRFRSRRLQSGWKRAGGFGARMACRPLRPGRPDSGLLGGGQP
jgi:hypothetical protein